MKTVCSRLLSCRAFPPITRFQNAPLWLGQEFQLGRLIAFLIVLGLDDPFHQQFERADACLCDTTLPHFLQSFLDNLSKPPTYLPSSDHHSSGLFGLFQHLSPILHITSSRGNNPDLCVFDCHCIREISTLVMLRLSLTPIMPLLPSATPSDQCSSVSQSGDPAPGPRSTVQAAQDLY